MQFDTASLIPLAPELFVLSMACAILVLDLFLKDEQRVYSYGLAQLTLIGALILTWSLAQPVTQVVFDGTAQEVLDNEDLRHEYLAI